MKYSIQAFFSNVRALKLRPGARETIAACRERKFPIGIVSANTPELVKAGMEQVAFEGFEFCAAVYRKQDGLVSALAHFEISDPKEAMYVEDTAGGIAAAKAAGVTVVGIRGGFGRAEDLNAAQPDYLVDELIEIPSLLDEIASA